MDGLPSTKRKFHWSVAVASCFIFFILFGLSSRALAVKAIWTRTCNGDADNDDYGRSTAVGPDGSVYVTGQIYVSGQNYDVWLRKYSPRGRVKWTRTYNGGDNLDDAGRGVAVAPDGSVYVAGYTVVSGQNNDIWLRKYSPRGRVKWTRTYNGDDNGIDYGYGVAVGLDGSVYVAGRTDVSGQGADIWLRKYSPRGRVKWTRTYNGDDNLSDLGRGVAVGPDGSVYVTGTVSVTGQSYDMWLRKYSPRGRVKWTRTYNGNDNLEDVGLGVAVGPDGSVYVAGRTDVAGQGSDIWLREYSPRGRAKWTRTYNGDDNLSDEGDSVTVGPDGGVYVTGETGDAVQGENVWLRKYSPRGRVKWTRTYDGGDNLTDAGRGVAVGPDNSVYVTGYTDVADQAYNIWLRKYR